MFYGPVCSAVDRDAALCPSANVRRHACTTISSTYSSKPPFVPLRLFVSLNQYGVRSTPIRHGVVLHGAGTMRTRSERKSGAMTRLS